MRERLFRLLSAVFDLRYQDINESLTKEQIYKWDSLVQMELVTTIENEFNIQLTIDEIMAMDSVMMIIQVLSKYGITVDVTEDSIS